MATKAEVAAAEREAKLAAEADVQHDEMDEGIRALRLQLGAEVIDFLPGQEWRSYSDGPGKPRVFKLFGAQRCKGRASEVGWAGPCVPCGNIVDLAWGVLCPGPCRPEGRSAAVAHLDIVFPAPLFVGTKWVGGVLTLNKRG